MGWLINAEIFPTRARALANAAAAAANWGANFLVSESFLHIKDAIKQGKRECLSGASGSGGGGGGAEAPGGNRSASAAAWRCPDQCKAATSTHPAVPHNSNAVGACSCETAGEGLTFLLYAGFCVCALAFVYLRMIETRGRSLEQIEEDIVRAAGGKGSSATTAKTTAVRRGSGSGAAFVEMSALRTSPSPSPSPSPL